MLIEFKSAQLRQFEHLCQRILAQPESYVDFSDVAEFYQAPWLSELPEGTQYWVSGLDDGAEQFDVCLCFQGYCLQLCIGQSKQVKYGKRHATID